MSSYTRVCTHEHSQSDRHTDKNEAKAQSPLYAYLEDNIYFSDLL